MTEVFDNFHLMRPYFLLALLPVLIFYIYWLRRRASDDTWHQIIPSHLYNAMLIQTGKKNSKAVTHIAFWSAFVCVIALAGPSWEKLPQQVYQAQAGKVILMDMSMSLRATDIAPNRLSRAKFKALDLLEEVSEGETGVVAYAGDAFVVSPLTEDINNLKTLIPVLSPEIMPSQGSNAIYGLEQAQALLKNAGYNEGQIYWITDGIAFDEIREIRDFAEQSAYTISALLVGTEAGAPILLDDGNMLKDRSGNIVVPSIKEHLLNQALGNTGSQYQMFTSDASDVRAMVQNIALSQQQQAEKVEQTKGDEYKDMGPFLALLLLPISLFAFRKGVLSSIAVLFACGAALTHSPLVVAQQSPSPTQEQSPPEASIPKVTLADPNAAPETWIDKVFKNNDQRGKIAFDNNDFDKAELLFDDPSWRATTAYKRGDYAQAAELYAGLDGAENKYNLGNALAKQGMLEQALSAYEQVLQVEPDHQNALQNKRIVESMLEQQQNQQQQNQQQQGDNSESQQGGDSQDQQQGQQSQSEQEQQNQDQQGQNGENQQNSEQSPSQQNGQPSSQQNQSQSDNDDALKQQQEEQEQQAQDAESEADKQQQTQGEPQKSAIVSDEILKNLTPEEKEALQRMQVLLNKVPDDPAFLLKRKMLLEAYKRKSTPPPPNQKNW